MTSFLIAALVLLACSATVASALNFNDFKVISVLPRGVIQIPRSPITIENAVGDYRVKLVKVGNTEENGLVPNGPVEVHIIGNDNQVWVRELLGEEEVYVSLIPAPVTDELLAHRRSQYTLAKESGGGYSISWKQPGVEAPITFFRYDDTLAVRPNVPLSSMFQFQEPEDVTTPEPTQGPTRKPTFALPDAFTLKFGDVYEIRNPTKGWIFAMDHVNPGTNGKLVYGQNSTPYRIRFTDPQNPSNRGEMRAGDPCWVQDNTGRYWTRVDGTDQMILAYFNDNYGSIQTWRIDGLGFNDEGAIVEGPLFGLHQKDPRSNRAAVALSVDTRFVTEVGLKQYFNVDTDGHLDFGVSGFELFPSEGVFPEPVPTWQPTIGSPVTSPTWQPTIGSPVTSPTQQPETTSPTIAPTKQPETASPTIPPTELPTTASPTTLPTRLPTYGTPTPLPTKQPMTASPVVPPTFNVPTTQPLTNPPSSQAPTVSPTTSPPTSPPGSTAGPTDPTATCQYLQGNGGCKDPQGQYRASPSRLFTNCGVGTPCDTRESCMTICAQYRFVNEDLCTGFSYSKSQQTCEIISGPIDPLNLYVPYNKPESYEEVCYLCNNALTATSPPAAMVTAAPTGQVTQKKCNYLQNYGACVTPGTNQVNQGVPFICDSIDGKCTSVECSDACIFKEGKCFGFQFNPKEETCNLMESPIRSDEVAAVANAGFCAICSEELGVEDFREVTSSASRAAEVSVLGITTFLAFVICQV